MEVSIQDINDVEKEISINAPASELAVHFEEAYRKQLPKIEIKGFRKGKVPLNMVKQLYGESIEHESLNTIASTFYRQVLEERDIQPIGEPVLVDMDYQCGKMFSFKIKYEIKPSIVLKEYKRVPIEKLIHNVADQELAGEIERLRKANSTSLPAVKAVDEEHVVIADIQQLDDSGAPIIGKKNAETRLYLAGGTMYKEIKDALLGAETGSTVRVKFDSTHDGHTHTNHLDIAVKKIEKVVLPEFNDEFVKTLTTEKMSTAAEFTAHLRTEMEAYWAEQSQRKLVDDLIGEIVKRHEFTVPESLVRSVTDSLVEDYKNHQKDKKLPGDFDDETFRQNNREYATFQAKWYLIRAEIIAAEKLTVDDADLEELVTAEAARIGIDKERLMTFYKSSDASKDRILTKKLMTLLESSAVITEKIADAATPA